ncbi:hypothetical protein K353_00220 [Kitasatospora sp. SolWspMP-SS2h]|nr:hypothetical protein [Kitasatospora sp. SolWspMP-SS2h]RAJ47019.1 hypothetical protein K353_00220 [Kitasatospora sp. SolWspMP-SS2h]
MPHEHEYEQFHDHDRDRRPDAEQRAVRRAALVARIRAANAETLERLAEL